MNSKRQRRHIIGVGVILAAAFAGLLMINSGPVSADRVTSIGPAHPTAQATPVTAAQEEFAGEAMPSLLRMVSALAIVIACIYGGLWLLKRTMGRGRTAGGGRTLEVIETVAVAPKKTVSLIRVADKSVLVGVTDSTLSVLTELSPEETVKVLERRQDAEAGDSFQKAFQTATGKLREFGLKRKETALEA